MSSNLTEFVLGGVGACCAAIFTNPLEVIKTRIQLQGELKSRGHYTVHYKNVFHAFYAIGRAESLVSLQKGLVPALWYQMIMNGFRLGIFQCCDNLGLTRDNKGEAIFYRNVIVGAFSGASGALFGSPFYLIKTHLQSRSNASIAVGHQHSHSRMSQAFISIFKSYGIHGLWRGCTASLTRVTIGGSIQLSTFSSAKSLIDKSKIIPKDNWINTLGAAMLGGIAVVCVMTPFDVISTRLYNQPVDNIGRGLKYSSYVDCVTKIWKTEGVPGFYKGWSASLLRLGPHTVLSLLFWQELRKKYFQLKVQYDRPISDNEATIISSPSTA